jgi:hypothetical protein
MVTTARVDKGRTSPAASELDDVSITIVAFPSPPDCARASPLTHLNFVHSVQSNKQQGRNMVLAHSVLIAPTVGIPISCVPL